MRSWIIGTGIVTALTRDPRDLNRVIAEGPLGYGPLAGGEWEALKGFRTTAGGTVPEEETEALVRSAAELGFGLDEAGRCGLFILSAVRDALEEAGLYPLPGGVRVGLAAGTNFGNADAIRETAARGEGAPDPAAVERYLFGTLAETAARAFGLKGPRAVVSLSCASGAAVVAQAARMLEVYPELDAVVACSGDVLDVYVFSGLHSLRAMSPENICRPWDANRKGTIFSEGAAAVVLAREPEPSFAVRPPLAAVAGTYQNNDAFHLSAPDTSARGITALIRGALEAAGKEPAEVDFVNLHGTGTVYNDRIETKAIEAVFGERAASVPVTSNKGALGHLMGAAGLVETVSAVRTLADGFLPPTRNLEEQDPELGLSVVTGEGLRGEFRTALKNSFGIGGANCCLVLERFDG